MKFVQICIIFFACLLFVAPMKAGIHAQESLPPKQLAEEKFEAIVTKIIEEKEIIPQGGNDKQLYQKIELRGLFGSYKDKIVIIENGNFASTSIQKYSINDKLYITHASGVAGDDVYYVTDFVRRDALAWLFIIFICVVLVIGKKYGFMSLLGMGLSFVVIFQYILPSILSGKNPITTAIIGSLIIVPASFYLSHGLNKKTSVAVVGTIISLVITGVLADVFVRFAKLTGFSSEEASFIQVIHQGSIDIKGLLLAGIIISGIGVFDDVTISQAAIVAQLKEALPKLTVNNLYAKAMSVGHDHIASVVNTLVLVYAGSALPLLVLFVGNPLSFSEVINTELIAEEIIKTLIASIGLVLSVPITTYIAAIAYGRSGVSGIH